MLKALIAAVAFGAMLSASCATATCDANATDRRGCCSHHNGVCGCDTRTNMLRCCDGTNSPSCDCDRIDRTTS
jgi:hypothetical protein